MFVFFFSFFTCVFAFYVVYGFFVVPEYDHRGFFAGFMAIRPLRRAVIEKDIYGLLSIIALMCNFGLCSSALILAFSPQHQT
jgi:hypothetical protein